MNGLNLEEKFKSLVDEYNKNVDKLNELEKELTQIKTKNVEITGMLKAYQEVSQALNAGNDHDHEHADHYHDEDGNVVEVETAEEPKTILMESNI